MISVFPQTFSFYVSTALLVLGLFFFAVGVVGLLRLPDVFSRLHATTKSDTLGIGLILGAAIVQYGPSVQALQIAVLFLFVAISTPTASHVIAKAVFKSAPKSTKEERVDTDR